MPYDPAPSEEMKVLPLSGLNPHGTWQTELAHDRPDQLLIWITRGQGRLLLDGSRRGFSAHCAIFVPANSLFAIEFGRNCIGRVLQVPGNSTVALPHRPHHLRVTASDQQARLNELFEAMRQEEKQNLALRQRAMLAYGELIGILLRRKIHDISAEQPKKNAAKRLSQAYCNKISADFQANVAMAEHATALDVTPTHLTRVCKAETGLTAAALLSQRQLHAAWMLLVETNMPMRDIAAELNFGSAAYFTRFITQHTGQTPSALRKNSRN